MSTIERIENWFSGEHEQGDFIRHEREWPFNVFGPQQGSECIIYCTKQTVAHRAFQEVQSTFNGGLITRFGLPREEDADWLRELVGERRLLFMGDLDPVDLMVFAWLRERLQPVTTVHHGINDSLIAALDVVIPQTYRIRLNSTEAAAVAELGELMPDVCDALGPTCLRILNEGYKIELEAIQSALGSAGPLLRSATSTGR